MNILLPSAYFGSVGWYARLLQGAAIEHSDSYQKQTCRNRCRIATVAGAQRLTVPVGRDAEGRAHISDHGSWRRVHWQALLSAYGESPFFDYYADDLRPFFEPGWDLLYDFNLDIARAILRLMDIDMDIKTTTAYAPAPAATLDLRSCSDPQWGLWPAGARPYYQVYADRIGFLPGLSILDLLFNMGLEAPLYLVP